jgi:hypothetical protein
MKVRRLKLKSTQSGSVNHDGTDRIEQKADILPGEINPAEKNRNLKNPNFLEGNCFAKRGFSTDSLGGRNTCALNRGLYVISSK